MEKLTKALGAVVLFLALLTLMAVIRGATLDALWGWFVVPLGVTNIGIAEAIGISMVVGFLTTDLRDTRSDEERKQSSWMLLGVAFFKGSFIAIWVLSLGWVVHQFAW